MRFSLKRFPLAETENNTHNAFLRRFSEFLLSANLRYLRISRGRQALPSDMAGFLGMTIRQFVYFRPLIALITALKEFKKISTIQIHV